MFVIYPADELILFTYGNINIIPKHRPTLDHIRDPKVPLSTLRPSPVDRTSVLSNSEPATVRFKTEDILSSNQQARQIRNEEEVWNSSSDPFYSSHSRSDSNPSIRVDLDPYEGSLHDNHYDNDNEYSLLDAAGKKKSKKGLPNLNIQSRFHKFSHSAPKTPENSRFKEQVHINVANPTFTKQNLRERNFEAFFQSGEPIVSEIIEEAQLDPLDNKANKRNAEYRTSEPRESRHVKHTHSTSTHDSVASAPTVSAINKANETKLKNSQEFGVDNTRELASKISPNRSAGGANLSSSATLSLPPSKPTTPTSTIPTTPTTPKSLNDQNYQHFTRSIEKEPVQKSTKKGLPFGFLKSRRSSTSKDALKAMAGGGGSSYLKDLANPALNETLKTHNGVTFKLVKTVSDFTESLSQLYDAHAESLQDLVSQYRMKNAELRKERPACQSSLFQAWETFLQEVEADSQGHSDIASTLSRQVSRPLIERSFHRKLQSRKIFTHRESFDTIISKTEEKLSKCRMDYKSSYSAYIGTPSQQHLTLYFDSHNTYVQQLHATNAMLEIYHGNTLPQLMQIFVYPSASSDHTNYNM